MKFLVVEPSPLISPSHPSWAQIFVSGSCFQILLATKEPYYYYYYYYYVSFMNNQYGLESAVYEDLHVQRHTERQISNS